MIESTDATPDAALDVDPAIIEPVIAFLVAGSLSSKEVLVCAPHLPGHGCDRIHDDGGSIATRWHAVPHAQLPHPVHHVMQQSVLLNDEDGCGGIILPSVGQDGGRRAAGDPGCGPSRSGPVHDTGIQVMEGAAGGDASTGLSVMLADEWVPLVTGIGILTLPHHVLGTDDRRGEGFLVVTEVTVTPTVTPARHEEVTVHQAVVGRGPSV